MAKTNVEQAPTVSQMKIITLQSPLTLFSLLTRCKVPARHRHKAYETEGAPKYSQDLVSVFKLKVMVYLG